MAHLTFSTVLASGSPQDIIDDELGNVHAGGRDAVAKLHRVIHFVDLKTFACFKDIDRDNTATHGFSGSDGNILKFVRQRAIHSFAAQRRIGDPVFGNAIDRRDAFITDDEAANITSTFLDVLLNVKNRVMVTTQRDLVLEDRFGGVTIVDFGEQASPRTNGWFQYNGITHGVDSLQRGLFGERDPDFRLRNFVLFQRDRRQDFIAAYGRHLGCVDTLDTGRLK